MIIRYDDFINEKYINLFGIDIKEYSNEIFELLQSAYKSIGGLKGNGFDNADDMYKHFKMCKISKKKGVIKAVLLYKDREGRKLVALGTDSTKEGKEELVKILKKEFERSYFEISDSLLRFIEKNLPNELEEYKINNHSDLKIFKDIERIDDYYYKRKIGKDIITKICLGTITDFY